MAFFYDMNVLGNRHVGRNVRILLVNNGKGTEFRNYMHPGAAFGEAADDYIAAPVTMAISRANWCATMRRIWDMNTFRPRIRRII